MSGYNTLSKSVTGVNVSEPILFKNPKDNFECLINAYVTGTVTYDIEYTIDDGELANAQWLTLGDVDRAAGSDDSLYFPVRAIRANVKTGTGTVKLVVLMRG